MKLNKYLIAGLSLAGLGGGLALAQVVAPQVTSIGSTDLIQVIPRGQPSAQSQYASAALLGNYVQAEAGMQLSERERNTRGSMIEVGDVSDTVGSPSQVRGGAGREERDVQTRGIRGLWHCRTQRQNL